MDTSVRIGAVSYLNSKPLIVALRELAPHATIVVDVPSRLADGLAGARLDVALVPSIEYFRNPGYRIVSDACIACAGPVKSVKLYGRVPPEAIRTLALDEGSRTSAVLARILLKERFGLEPRLEWLPIGEPLEAATSDAVVLIGDRAMRPPAGRFAFTWDLGEQWFRWTGLPFVFSTWIAREGIEIAGLDELFASARDQGLRRLEEIAAREAPVVGISRAECLVYLRDHLAFYLGDRQRCGLETFGRLARKHHLILPGASLVGDDRKRA